MIGREKRVLLRHYLEQGMPKAEIARQLHWATMHWLWSRIQDRIETAALARRGEHRGGPPDAWVTSLLSHFQASHRLTPLALLLDPWIHLTRPNRSPDRPSSETSTENAYLNIISVHDTGRYGIRREGDPPGNHARIGLLIRPRLTAGISAHRETTCTHSDLEDLGHTGIQQ